MTAATPLDGAAPASATTLDAPPTDGVGVRSADEVRRLVAANAALLERMRQLEYALESRIVIEQAKGILAERFGLEMRDAFELLRRSARSHGLKLRALAHRVVESPETPGEISALQSSGRFPTNGA